MPIFRMRNQGERGIINDIPSYDLPPNAWSDGKNVRFEASRVQKIGGWAPIVLDSMPFIQHTKPDPNSSGTIPDYTTVQTPLACTPRPLTEALLYGTATGIFEVEGVTHTPRTTGMTFNVPMDQRWEYTTISNSVVFNTETADPVGILKEANSFIKLPGWAIPKASNWDTTSYPPKLTTNTQVPGGWKAKVIRSYKDHLVALFMTEGGTEMPQRVRWSDVTYANQLPGNWIEDWENSDAGFNDLTDSTGEIIDARQLRDSLIIYTNRDTFAMDYVGGDLVFNFRKIFPDSGILSRNCVAEFELGHFVISEDDIFVHDGSTRRPVASSRVKDHLLNEITGTKYEATFVNVDTHHNEIWIYYVAPGGATNNVVVDPTNPSHVVTNHIDEWACNKAAIWNWKYDTWTYADLPNVYDVAYHIPPDSDKRQWLNFDTPNDDSWGDDNDTTGSKHATEHWRAASNAFTNRRLIGASAQSCFMVMDQGYYQSFVGWTNGTGSARPSYIMDKKPVICELTRTGIDFDEQETDISYNKCWRAIYPQMGGIGTVTFQVGGTNDPYSEPTWDTTQNFVIGTDYRVDCWSNYKYNAIRIQDFYEGEWNFTGFDIDYFREGNR